MSDSTTQMPVITVETVEEAVEAYVERKSYDAGLPDAVVEFLKRNSDLVIPFILDVSKHEEPEDIFAAVSEALALSRVELKSLKARLKEAFVAKCHGLKLA